MQGAASDADGPRHTIRTWEFNVNSLDIRTALLRKDLVQRAHSTSKLWVSLWMNHDGVLDDQGNTVIRLRGCRWRRAG
ncbi:hypothetical protein [Streptomyces echinatus]|uniref:Putative Fe-S cluster-containing MiaB family protein n=1 Tax=Streptomyces echinatus TaxID=67293 RepID=A0A7W9Q2U7_9ACTN|nr:hypothetical protein [Streptomyces echinatus]MBB5932606.1 putative Fe-S cluster-containing MiaB family protein [Streptomyces echinatus]